MDYRVCRSESRRRQCWWEYHQQYSYSGRDPVGNEETHEMYPKSYLDKLWEYVCPGTTGLDDSWINSGMDPKLSRFGCKRVLVYVAEKDFMKERGWFYKEVLRKSGWDGEIEVVDVEGEDHIFSVFAPDSENGMAMLKKVAAFINE
ncbi:hypothetical protein DH2020_030579 [Rehmannia glutinosa]|uniref:Alpha/beta hydrolase fold-3 domain-containing protein n=1 Tax=Rehmannia glutinosa TaxID=99300 RepID=A0ABR0VMY8_REHGL